MITSDLFDKKQLECGKKSKQKMTFLYKYVVLFYCRVSEDAETSGFSLAVQGCGPKEKSAG